MLSDSGTFLGSASDHSADTPGVQDTGARVIVIPVGKAFKFQELLLHLLFSGDNARKKK